MGSIDHFTFVCFVFKSHTLCNRSAIANKKTNLIHLIKPKDVFWLLNLQVHSEPFPQSPNWNVEFYNSNTMHVPFPLFLVIPVSFASSATLALSVCSSSFKPGSSDSCSFNLVFSVSSTPFSVVVFRARSNSCFCDWSWKIHHIQHFKIVSWYTL